MMAATRTAVTTHVVRLLVSLLLSVVTLVVLIALVRASSTLQAFVWFVVPLSVVVGFAPMIRWYGRDAYPIGLVYCPVIFFLLRYLVQICGS